MSTAEVGKTSSAQQPTQHQWRRETFILYSPTLIEQSEQYSELLKLMTRPQFTYPINPCVPTAISVTDCLILKFILKYNIHLQFIQSEQTSIHLTKSFLQRDSLLLNSFTAKQVAATTACHFLPQNTKVLPRHFCLCRNQRMMLY